MLNMYIVVLHLHLSRNAVDYNICLGKEETWMDDMCSGIWGRVMKVGESKPRPGFVFVVGVLGLG